ncbi:uncharacterized protein [Mytilus edulis]|uniref:uncharacterized protein n=1 Tax=Mytilus edulis TaxID=6550 RepID=UPI0039EFD18B
MFKSRSRKPDVKMCGNCQHKGTKVQYWCTHIECRHFVCKTCKDNSHERIRHKVLPINTTQQLSPLFLQLSELCEEHPDKKVTLVCRDHDKLICDVCESGEHQDCKLISTEKAASGVKDGTAMSSLERRMEDQTQVSKQMLNKTEEELTTLKETRIELKKRVSQIKQKSVDRLNELEEDMNTKIDCMYKICNETLTTNRESLLSSASLLLKGKIDLDFLKQNTSEFHLYQSVKFLEKSTNKEESEIRKIQIATVPTIKYCPSALASNMENLLADLGTLTLENVLVQNPELQCDQEGQSHVRDQRKLLMTNSFQRTKLGDNVGIGGGCFISGDRLLIGHYGDTKLSICNLDGSNCKTLNLDYKPGCIIPYDNDHALVSAGQEGIQIIDLTSFKPDRKIEVTGDCTGIAIAKEHIWIKNESNTLRIIDINGKILNTIKTTFDPCDICATKEGDVCCTDCDSDKVFVVTSDGKERELYSSSDLKSIGGVAVDDSGDVFIAGYSSNNIHKLNHYQQKQGIIMAVDDLINRPTGLSYNNETKELLVVNDQHQYINIYKQQ